MWTGFARISADTGLKISASAGIRAARHAHALRTAGIGASPISSMRLPQAAKVPLDSAVRAAAGQRNRHLGLREAGQVVLRRGFRSGHRTLYFILSGMLQGAIRGAAFAGGAPACSIRQARSAYFFIPINALFRPYNARLTCEAAARFARPGRTRKPGYWRDLCR